MAKKQGGMKKTYPKGKMWETVLADWKKEDEKTKKAKKK
jgi:hypothetical protein